MSFDNSLVDEILKRADIVKVISSFLNLTKDGKDYLGICPFHDDKRPSMHVSPTKQIFKCFSCGTGGDAISFVQKYLHISFFEALKKVAEIIGFDDPRLHKNVSNKPVDEKRKALINCLKDLTSYYQYALNTDEGKAGLDYFLSRNLDSSIQQKYKLGYSYANGKNTIEFLKNKGHSLKTIEDTGISFLNNGEYCDKSQGRAIFPICDKNGDVIGFSARRISDNKDESKYINSPETYLFHKSSVLYNYHIAKDKAKINNCLYVCEGFMDIFALSKIGIDNAVAIMGTALTSEHITMLRALNVEIILCLDGDLPGQTAMMKASKLLAQNGIKHSIVDNKNSTKDPDEILNQEGEESLKNYLKKTLSRIDFALNYYLNSNPLTKQEQKRDLVYNFLPVLSSIKSELDLDNYVRKLSKITNYDVNSIYELLKKTNNVQDPIVKKELISNFHPENIELRRLMFAEREFLYQMINNKSAVKFYENNLNAFYDEIYRSIANFIVDYMSSHDDLNLNNIVSSINSSDIKNKDELINEITQLSFEKFHPKECNDELLVNLLESINVEKKRIFEKDTLEKALEGKDTLEKARIIAEFNRKRVRNK